MGKTFVSEGKVMPWTNGGSAVVAGAVVVFGERVGIALEDIAAGAVGSLGVEGVFSMTKKAATAMAQGDLAFWDVTPGEITDVDVDGIRAGMVWVAAASADLTAQIKLYSDRSA